MTDGIVASLLGVFRLQIGGEDLRLRGRKACGLIAHLLTNPDRRATRVQLADLLWSDRGDDQARNSLRQTLRELRASPIGAAIEVTRSEVSAPADRIVSDIEQIGMLAKQRDCAGLAKLLTGVDGEFLHDLNDISPAFDEWLRTQRVRQRDWLLASALECLGEADMAPDVEQVMLRELERLDPLNEAVLRMRMRRDHASGNVAALHRRYRRLSDDLSRELNVSPSAETRELFDRLVASGDQSSPPPPPIVTEPRVAVAPSPRTPPLVAVSPFASGSDDTIVSLAAILTDGICAAVSHVGEFNLVHVETIGQDRLSALVDRSIAAFTLHGSVRQFGAMITVAARLTNIESGLLIWSEQFQIAEPDAGRVTAIIGQIVGAIGPGIERHLTNHEGNIASDGADDQAASLYSRGKRLARDARTLDAVRDGIAMIERSLELDPRHVGARLRLAQLYNTDFHYLMAGHDWEAMRDRAHVLALEAAEIEPQSTRVRLRLAWCRLRQQDWRGASELFHSAKGALLHDADAMDEIGFGLAQLGELDDAHELIQRAFKYNPFAPAEYHADFAVLQALQGNHALAEEYFQVCGEQRLFWQVVRLSNLHRLDRSAAKLRSLQEHFVRTFRQIWVQPKPPTLDDVLHWSRTIFCLKEDSHRDLISEGLTSAWLTFALDAVDDGSRQKPAIITREWRPRRRVMPLRISTHGFRKQQRIDSFD